MGMPMATGKPDPEDPAAILTRVAALGASHGREMAGRQELFFFGHEEVLATAGLTWKDRLRHQVIAVYEDSRDIARAEASGTETYSQPIADGHKMWLRANLVNHGDLARLLQVPVPVIVHAAEHPSWPKPVIDLDKRRWYWWPFARRALTRAGLQVPAGTHTPPTGPVPSWWGHRHRDEEQWTPDLRDLLMNLAQFEETHQVKFHEVMRYARFPDYPEAVINRGPKNVWHWAADLDRFLQRHRWTRDLEPKRTGNSRNRRNPYCLSEDFPAGIPLATDRPPGSKSAAPTRRKGDAADSPRQAHPRRPR